MTNRCTAPFGCGSAMCDGRTATCLGCGAVQCFANGLGRGCCKVCHFGILPGWSGSDRPCDYKGCTERAAFRYVPRVKSVCLAHATRAKVRGKTLRDYVRERLMSIPGYVQYISAPHPDAAPVCTISG